MFPDIITRMCASALRPIASTVARLLDVVAPRRCAGCGAASAHILCELCVEVAQALPRPAPHHAGSCVCRAALPLASPAQAAIHAAKYRGCRRAMHVLGALAAERLAPDLLAGGPPEAVVAVPLGARRRRTRGYNQAEVAAAAICDACGLPPPCAGLRRIRDTPAQVGLGADARRRNLAGAFRWDGPPLGGGTVWLVDDVVTTGTTLRAAAYALQQAGAGRIEAVAVAASTRRRG